MTGEPIACEDPGRALARAAELLEAGDAQGAALAMSAAAAACAVQARWTPEAIADMRRQFDRCQRAEAALRHKLVVALEQAASGRRAHGAYGGADAWPGPR
jgi:hypothetical protein